MKKSLLLLLLLPLFSFKLGQMDKSLHLKPYYHHEVGIDEPSDICESGDPDHFFVVGDRGAIAEIDGNGQVLHKTNNNGSDYEGCCHKDGILYVMDESMRRIDMVDPTNLKVTKSIYLHYMGPRNKGFEGLTYIPERKTFVAVIEKPCMVFELNEQLQTVSEIRANQFYELSSVRYHKGFLYFLSDEDHEIMQCDMNDYHIINRWKIPVVNPEGIAFDNDGNILITSDDFATLYKFKLPQP